MKYIMSLLIALCISVMGYADVVREGNNFRETTTSVNQGEKTEYTYTDSKGNTYPVYKSKRGSYFIIRVSKKTNKEYKQYLKKEIQEQINKTK